MNKKQLCKRCGKLMDENAIGEHYKWEECVSHLVKTIAKLEDELDDRDNGIETKECEWEWQDEEEAYYVTKCGKSFMFTNGDTLSEDKYFKYCPYCGKVIKETEYDSSYDSLIPEDEEVE